MKLTNIMLALVGLLLASCSDMLEEAPKDFVSRSNYYRSEADAQGALNGAYSSLSPDFYDLNSHLLAELHSDLIMGRGSQASVSNMSRVLDQANINRVASLWSALYSGINRANAVLNNVQMIENINESARTRIIAEARFLRALAYFELVRGWGGVPIKTKESTDLSELEAPRKSENEVYNFIIDDLLEAEKGLLETVGSSTGQASKAAARMLLAHVYLTKGDWQACADKAEQVIGSGAYRLLEVSKADDFYQIFASNTHPEDIMSVHHSEIRQSDVVRYLHMGSNIPYNYNSTGYFAWLPNTSSIIGEEWDDNDLRRSFNLYTHVLDASGNWVPLASTTPVLFKKFISNTSGLRMHSLPIYRYTEALLFFAEASCQAEGAPSATALERLNMVRRRAYGYDSKTVSPVDYKPGMDKETFLDAVLRERAYEFVIERRRWWDLKRTGKAKEALAAVGRPMIDERLMWPIPENEINNNPGIGQADQNPGY